MLHRQTNEFQLGIDACRALIQTQVGTKFTASTSALSGHWLDENGNYYDANFEITDVSSSKGNVARGYSPDDSTTFEFPPVIFLNVGTKVSWRPIPSSIRQKWMMELTGDKHHNSMKRAYSFMKVYISRHGCAPKDIIVILDGNGENRIGMHRALTEAGIPEKFWPTILTFEMDPNVAFANQLMFGVDYIRFTGADPAFRCKSLLGKGGVMLEHLIVKHNSTFTDVMKSRTRAVYFDYCGGPAGNQTPDKCRLNFEKNIMPSLPNLWVIAMTMSYRKHPVLKSGGIREYAYIPSKFKRMETFFDNTKVICELYATDEERNRPKKMRRIV